MRRGYKKRTQFVKIALLSVFLSIFSILPHTTLATDGYPFDADSLKYTEKEDRQSDNTSIISDKNGVKFINTTEECTDPAAVEGFLKRPLTDACNDNSDHARLFFLSPADSGSKDYYVLVVKESNPKEGKLWRFKNGDDEWEENIDTLPIGGSLENDAFTSIVLKKTKIRPFLVGDEGKSNDLNLAFYGLMETIVSFFKEGTSNTMQLYSENTDDSVNISPTLEPIAKTAEGYPYVAFNEKAVDLVCPGSYSLSFHQGRSSTWADIISGKFGDSAIGGEYSIDADLAFSLDNDCKVTIDSSDEIAKSSPANNQTMISDGDVAKFNVPLIITETNPLDRAISKAIGWTVEGVASLLKWTMGNINGLLVETENIVIGTEYIDSGLQGPWLSIRNIALSLLVMALVIIAFANVAQVNIEQYGLNRMIPRIIISIIMAYASWIIVIFFFDFSSAIQTQAQGLAGKVNLLETLSKIKTTTPSTGQVLGNLGILIAVIVILVLVLVCGIVLLFTLFLRIVMLSFLLVVAPLAFILNIMPFTANLYKQWWSEFFKWMFMGPIAMAMISLGGIIAGSVGFGTDTQSLLETDSFYKTVSLTTTSARGTALIGLAIFGASLYMAATLPMQWGGKIMGKWAGAGKNLWGKTGGAALGGARKGAGLAGKWAWNNSGGKVTQPIAGAWKDWRGDVNRRRDNANLKNANHIRNAFGSGTDPDVMERKLFDAEVATAGDKIGAGSAGQPKLIQRYKDSKNDFERAAIMRQMAKEGDLEKLFASKGSLDPETGAWKDGTDDSARIARQKAGMELARLSGKDQALESLVMSNQAELFVAGHEGFKSMATKGALGTADAKAANYAKAKYGATLASQKNKTLREKRANIFDDIAPEDIGKFLSDFDKENIGNANVSSSKVVSKYNDFLSRSGTGVGEAGAGEPASQPDQSSPSVGADGAPGGYRGVGEDD